MLQSTATCSNTATNSQNEVVPNWHDSSYAPQLFSATLDDKFGG